jgi:hypothetical protein
VLNLGGIIAVYYAEAFTLLIDNSDFGNAAPYHFVGFGGSSPGTRDKSPNDPPGVSFLPFEFAFALIAAIAIRLIKNLDTETAQTGRKWVTIELHSLNDCERTAKLLCAMNSWHPLFRGDR